ncbi:YeeE/YedE thiosulfate transporter family protein [Aureimonas sp. SK2]|uniref:YeeE/YedE thiosulfate transporter family protein n=1 Tax=Aureimonas sp. SK2 TaxID=3015992 RepID=UPI002443A3C0|nr:YeeE/YedE thiosulfate transporter family protein [Aureimonas sp. SK2]
MSSTVRAQETGAPRSGYAATRILLPVLLAAALVLGGLALSRAGAQGGALSLVFGAAFGLVLQRSRFCFYCAIREWLEEREPDGVLGLLTALAAGAVGYALVFGAWMPDPGTGRLPPDAFIGPLAWTLVFGGLAFGVGMAVSGSCLSAHLYRLGEGSPTAPFALLGAVAGFVLGFLTWNDLYLAFVAEAPVVWLPARLGYPGWLALTLIALLALAWAPLQRGSSRRAEQAQARAALPPGPLRPLRSVFSGRWPGWLGGFLVGALGTFAYLRVAPLGVTAELSARSRDIGHAVGILPDTLLGLDTLRGCISLVSQALLSNNGLFVAGLVAASLAAALASGQAAAQRPRRAHVWRGLAGGLLLGWGATVALGCSVGTLLSGIQAGALSGWVFGAAMLAGIVAWRAAERRLGRR